MSTGTKTPIVEKKNPEKTVDLPPKGDRNTDPLSGAAGSHPIETGIGAVLGGAASGLAIGMVGGPVGAVIGGIIGGAAAGGLAGKGVGELIDPTTVDNWLRDYSTKQKLAKGETADTYQPAYHYGVAASERHSGRTYDEAEKDLRSEWDAARGDAGLEWDRACGAVQDAYDRARRERSAHRDESKAKRS